ISHKIRASQRRARQGRLQMQIRVRGIVLIAVAGALLAPAREGAPADSAAGAPRIWAEKDLADWATPVAGIKLRPNHYSEAEYYAAPIDNLRTYPVYHPDREPAGYLEKLKKLGPQPLVERDKLRTERDWLEAGSRVFDELDVPMVRTAEP